MQAQSTKDHRSRAFFFALQRNDLTKKFRWITLNSRSAGNLTILAVSEPASDAQISLLHNCHCKLIFVHHADFIFEGSRRCLVGGGSWAEFCIQMYISIGWLFPVRLMRAGWVFDLNAMRLCNNEYSFIYIYIYFFWMMAQWWHIFFWIFSFEDILSRPL